MISPDPLKEDTYKDLDLQHVTRQTINRIEKHLGRHFQFVATVHNDHIPLRHVHGIFLLHGRLSKEEFRALQKTAYLTATQQARLQRKAQDRVRQNPRYYTFNHSLTKAFTPNWQGREYKPLRIQSGCLSCGYGQLTGIPIYLSRCPVCHRRLSRVLAGLSLG